MQSVERVGRYEIRRVLGQGATSMVYQGWDDIAKRDVALKVLLPAILKDPQRGNIYQRFLLNEAALIDKLDHPNIIQIYDAVLDLSSYSYVVMEFASGGTVLPFCSKNNLLPIPRVLEIVFKCSRALDFAHRWGITHRDIKPANVLFNETGDVRITDFGTAIGMRPTDTLVTGVGSPAYMSPQQVREHPLNHQTDIYSLGVMMFQMLTGSLPYDAQSSEHMIHNIVHKAAPLPSTLRPEISPMMDRVVKKAMEKSLEDRYQTWEEISQDLAEFFHHSGMSSRPENVSQYLDTSSAPSGALPLVKPSK